jgi:hypothetical protein
LGRQGTQERWRKSSLRTTALGKKLRMALVQSLKQRTQTSSLKAQGKKHRTALAKSLMASRLGKELLMAWVLAGSRRWEQQEYWQNIRRILEVQRTQLIPKRR